MNENSKIQKIKTHLVENKKLYIGLGGGVVVGYCAFLLMNKSTTGAQIINKPIILFSPRSQANPTVINLIERSTRSRPVHLVGTNLYFNSLSEASRKTGHHLSMLSKHINGQLPDLNGDVFELLEPAA